MDNFSYDNDEVIVVTSFNKKEVTNQPINGQGGMLPMYSVNDENINHQSFSTEPASAPYANMSKEDVLRFSNTPFWKTLRMVFLIVFWLVWLAFLATVIALTITTPRCGPLPHKEWYQKGVFYDVYVRSFYDSDNNGVGDIKGIQEKLEGLREMGVGVLVLSSTMKSRSAKSSSVPAYKGKYDYGYEVEDFKMVDDSVGSNLDLQELIAAAHQLGMKVVMDFVPNHSGIDHDWFQKFKSSTGYDPNWNSYVSANQNPNNWGNFYDQSLSAWVGTGNGNLHYSQFLDTQPELNLRSNRVRTELESSLKHWMELGLDGFRLVRSDFLLENSDLERNPDGEYSNNRYLDDSIDLIARWKQVVASFNNESRVLITDGDSKHHEFAERYYRKGCEVTSHIPINYDLAGVTIRNFKLEDLRESLKNFLSSIPEGSIALWTTGSQDHSRIASRLWVNMTHPLTLIKMTLPGSALIYYGEEIEMFDDEQNANLEMDPVVEINPSSSRYGFRQPMAWSNSSNGGFSSSASTPPWLSLNPGVDLLTRNVEHQKGVEDSVWNLVGRLSQLRLKEISLQHGNTHFGYYDERIMTFMREYQGGDRLLIVVNLSQKASEVADVTKDMDHPVEATATVALTTHPSGGPYSVGDEVSLKEVVSLPGGYGFVARWKYVRGL